MGWGGPGAAPGERGNTARQEEGTAHGTPDPTAGRQSWALQACCEQGEGAPAEWGTPGVGGPEGRCGGPRGEGGCLRAGAGAYTALFPRSTDRHGAACLSPPSPLMQLGTPRAQNVRMEGWRHRPSGSAPGGSLGGREPRLPGEKTLSVVSVNVFKFLILGVKKYILRPGHSRPEQQAPGQGSTLVVSV